ncbi:MAG: hypothetical protein ACJ739_05725 [Acidimicrobiales bacterium]
MGLLRRKKDVTAQVIDLREPEPSKAAWGSPVPCPECSGRGYLDHIDPFREVMFMHCTQCSAKYEMTRAEMTPVVTSTEAFTT